MLLVDQYKKQTIESLAKRDSIQLEVKTTEMIGIDLEAILKNPQSAQDLILLEGDVLSVPKELQTVRMRGELLFLLLLALKKVQVLSSTSPVREALQTALGRVSPTWSMLTEMSTGPRSSYLFPSFPVWSRFRDCRSPKTRA